MSKGDKVIVIYGSPETPLTAEVTAGMNGSSVAWNMDREWLKVEEISKVGKIVRTLKVRTGSVMSVLDEPIRPG